MLGTDVEARCRLILQDPSAARWSDDEMAIWINDACRFVALKRPDSCVFNGDMALVAGPKQSIAGRTPKGVAMMDITRAKVSGRAIRLVDRETLDAYVPGWYNGTAGVPTNWVYDNRDPTTFYVYPPAEDGVVIEGAYFREPVALASGSELGSVALSISDIFIDPVANYVLHRAYAKDADDTQNMALSAGYLQACVVLLEGEGRKRPAFSPSFNSAGGKPTAGAASGAA